MSVECYSGKLQSRAERAILWSDRFNEAAHAMIDAMSSGDSIPVRIGKVAFNLGKTYANLPPTVATSLLFRHSLALEIEGLEVRTHMEYDLVRSPRSVDTEVHEYRLPGMLKFMSEIDIAHHIAATAA